MQFIKLIVIIYKQKLYFCEVTNLQVLAKIKFLRTFPN